MNTLEKQYRILNAILEKQLITPEGKNIILHPKNDVEGISVWDVDSFLHKLENDEKVIKIKSQSALSAKSNIPKPLKDTLDKLPFSNTEHINDSFVIEVLKKFSEFYETTKKNHLNYLKENLTEKTEEREPNSNKMQMLIAGMAMKYWGYTPNDHKKPIPAQKISDDVLGELGHTLSDDTIRDYLRRGWEIKKDKDKK